MEVVRTAVLLSGGQDSAAVAYWQRPDLAVFVDYGQIPAAAEARAATAIAAELGVELTALKVDCIGIGSGQLANEGELPIAPTPEWWPFRNQLLITLASAICVKRGIGEVLIGTVRDDGRHADGTSAFVIAMDAVLTMQEGKLRLRAPSSSLSSEELILKSRIPASILAWTHSCFVSNIPCLSCRGCKKHLRVLEAANLRWPTENKLDKEN
jgi:7-cyano-7-deazaguanine synthase